MDGSSPLWEDVVGSHRLATLSGSEYQNAQAWQQTPPPPISFLKLVQCVVTLGLAALGPRVLILTQILFLNSSSSFVFRHWLSPSFVQCKRSFGKDLSDFTEYTFILSHFLSLEIYNTVRNLETHRCVAILLIQNI